MGEHWAVESTREMSTFTNIPPMKDNFKNKDENTIKALLTDDYTTTHMGYAELTRPDGK
jgi:hypothetical protein